jgi:hypothetical protein
VTGGVGGVREKSRATLTDVIQGNGNGSKEKERKERE